MLRIKQVGSYSIARYPQAEFRPWRQPAAVTFVRTTTVSTALLFILESCDLMGSGTTGPPPVSPEMITENEARQVIMRVFSENGISLVPDVPLKLVDSNSDTIDVVLDGYDDSLRVGYEYIAKEDDFPLTPELREGIRVNYADSGPYIGWSWVDYNKLHLEYQMQEFIDSLKALGKI